MSGARICARGCTLWALLLTSFLFGQDSKLPTGQAIPSYSLTVFAKELPNAPSYQALTDQEKFQVFADDARSPLTMATAGVAAGYNTSRNRMYGSGVSGFGRNYAFAVTRQETTAFFGKYLFPTLLDQDPRYHPADGGNTFGRASYAASRVLITRSDSGKHVLNTSYLLGALVSSAIANTYRAPRYRGVGPTFSDWGSTVGGDAGMNLFREFWPQLGPKLLGLTPRPLRSFGGKIADKFSGKSKNAPEESPLAQ